MASKEMYALGSQASVIRDLFAYGQEQAAIVGKENVFDFSIGNPTVPAPACVKEAIEDILKRGNPWPSTAIRQLPVMRLSARAWPIT